jgi:hypothetical protein
MIIIRQSRPPDIVVKYAESMALGLLLSLASQAPAVAAEATG